MRGHLNVKHVFHLGIHVNYPVFFYGILRKFVFYRQVLHKSRQQ